MPSTPAPRSPLRSSWADLAARTRQARYGLAVALALVALGAGHVLIEDSESPPYTLLVGAVAISTWYGGLWPGLLTTLIGWSLSPIVMSETPDLSLAELDETRWTISLVVGLIVVWVNSVLLSGRERATTAAGQMEALQELTTALSAALTSSDVAHDLIRRAAPLVGARGGGLGLIEGNELVMVEPLGFESEEVASWIRLPLSATTPITRAATEGTLMRARDRTSLEREFPDRAAISPTVQAVIAVPLRAGGRVVGALTFHYDDATAIHGESEAIATIAADLGGTALERARLYEHEQQLRRTLDRILRVTPRLYAGSMDEVSLEICREARRALGADITEIWRVAEDSVWLELVCRDPESERLSKDERLEIGHLPGLKEAIEKLEVTLVADAEGRLDGELLEYVREVGIKSWLWAPVAVSGRAQRVLFFSWKTAVGQPDPSLLVLSRRFSDHAGLALEQLERRDAEERAAIRALETRRLLDSTAALAMASSPAEVAAAILSEGVRSLGATTGVLFGLTADGDELEVLDSRGYRPDQPEQWHTIPLEADVPLAHAAREEELVVIENVEALRARYPALASTRASTDSSLLAIPLSVADSVLGVVGLSFAKERTFSDAELDFAEALGRQSGQALERSLLLAAEHAARTRAEELVALANALSDAVTTSDVVQAVRRHLLDRVGVSAVGVYIPGRNGVGLELVDPEESAFGNDVERRRLSLDASSPPAESARERRDVWLETDDEWAPYPDAASWQSAGSHSLGAVPLVVNRRLVGVLVIGYEQEGDLSDDARGIVQSIGTRAAQALERAWLMEREQAARVGAETASRRTRRLQSITQELAAAPASREVAEIVVREALAAVAGDAAVLLTFDQDGLEPEVLVTGGIDDDVVTPGLVGAVASAGLGGSLVVVDDSEADTRANELRDAAAASSLEGAIVVPLGVGGRTIAALFIGYQVRPRLTVDDTALLQTVARIGAQALERSKLFDEEQSLRRRTERIQQLTQALSEAITQQEVAEVAVDALVLGAGADGAALSIMLEDRQVQKKLAWRGYEPEAQETWLEIPLSDPTPGNAALRTGRTLSFETLEALAEDFPESAAAMRATGHEYFHFIPLVSGGRTNGLVITSFTDSESVNQEDLTFVELLMSQVAQALDRARSFELERTIAETLQRSVLPVALPTLPNVQLAARYLPGTDEVDVGGDWFDAILLPTGRLGLVVGDVVGKGVQAAATMAQLRNALWAFALDQMKPSSTISRLNRLTEEIAESAFATVVYAVLDPDTGVCRFTSAGHPPPLVVQPDGRAMYVEGGRGLPLGTGANVRYRQETLELPVGSTIILYTDGLIERRSESIDTGLERLRTAVESAPGDPERLLDYVLQAMVGGEGRRDDIAVLAVRLLAVAPKPLELDLPSGSRSLDLVRDAVRTWLERAPASESEAHDIVLATWEACANAVEHPAGAESQRPHPGMTFSLRAELENSTVRVTVTDRGRWQEERDRPDRGLGLHLMRAMMSAVEIDSGETGTRVRFEKTLAQSGAPAS